MITPRLQAIINLVTAKTVADIGTDHAFIPIRLAQDKKITRAIATDKNRGPIEIARGNVEKYGFSEIIELRYGAGLCPIEKGEVQQIIIAGMGGVLIGDIIEESIDKAKASELILQPMNAQSELRKRLFEMGFKIEVEELSCEGFKVYNLMRVHFEPQEKRYEEIDLHLPPSLIRHPLWDMLVAKKEREFLKIINGQKQGAAPDYIMLEKYERLLADLEYIKKG